MPPDLLNPSYTELIDIFSLGIVALNLLFDISFYDALIYEKYSTSDSFMEYFEKYFSINPESKQVAVNNLLKLYFKSYSYENVSKIDDYQNSISKNPMLAYSYDSTISDENEESNTLSDNDKIFMMLSMLQVFFFGFCSNVYIT